MIDTELLQILCCPESRQPLSLANPDIVDRLNRAIAAGSLTNRAGQPVKEPMDTGLIREDQQYVYPIRADIPVLLADEAIPIEPEGQ